MITKEWLIFGFVLSVLCLVVGRLGYQASKRKIGSANQTLSQFEKAEVCFNEGNRLLDRQEYEKAIAKQIVIQYSPKPI